MDALDLNMLDAHDASIGEASFKSNNIHKKSVTGIKEKKTSDFVRSKAVVTYSAAKYPALFSQLAPFTNLNLAPSNWLRSAPGLRPNVILSGSRSMPTYSHNDRPLFTSFQMADSHLNYVGEIDVVSDAENLKKLLKVPFSKTHVSMAIHRIGNTLLLEHFDIDHIALKIHTWNWFRSMYKNNTPTSSMKKKLPSAQHKRLMLSKFLYYSVRKGNTIDKCEDVESDISIEELSSAQQHSTVSSSTHNQTLSKKASECSLVPAETKWKYWTPLETGESQCYDIRNTFERTIFWTFEDLQMLLGTNMPIFGGGEYPAVSLRLKDSNKPINVLTGIDYWLDNLICNVPEVVMCFHVNGIVQKYEVIKTEEIPKISAPKFSPQVIKDIAQNILSFLKSNCTKEGHTYWLFKGSNDDVVKLYDLTSLCSSQSSKTVPQNDLHNPFTMSVATLLFKMAVNLMKQQQLVASTEQNKTIKKLLHNCVKLLETQAELAPVMLDAALCMLSTLCLPDFTDDIVSIPSNTSKMRSRSVSSSEKTDVNLTSDTELDSAEIAVIPSVSDLYIPEKFTASAKKVTMANNVETNSSSFKKSRNDESDDYEVALSYVIKGLDVFDRFSSIKQGFSNTKTTDMLFVHMQMIRNTALLYYSIAKQKFAAQNYGRALQCVKVSLLSYEYLEQLLDLQLQQNVVNKDEENSEYDIAAVLKSTTPPEFNLFLPKLLALSGDIQMMQCQWTSKKKALFQAEFKEGCGNDTAICKALEKNFTGVGEKYKDAINPSTNLEEILIACRFCFETAVEKVNSNSIILTQNKIGNESRFKDSKKKGRETNKSENQKSLGFSLNRKLGHVANEQGALILDKAVQMLNDSDKACEKEQKIWKLSFGHFETALKSFSDAGDSINQALVQSNLGRLMRVCAQGTAQTEKEKFTLNEQHLYDNAIDYYKKALALQKQTAKNRKSVSAEKLNQQVPTVSDNISWELSGAYFALAKRLQDHPPLYIKSQNEIEKMILDLLNKSLKCSIDIWKNTEKRNCALHHCAKIHYRLASLYHNTFRQTDDPNKNRQIRTLAETHYEKSSMLYGNLSDIHMCEFLRVILERLALREQQLPFITKQSSKIKLILDGFQIMSQCVRPLNVLSTFLKKYLKGVESAASTPVDPQNHSSEFNILDLKEWKTLLDILCTIHKSFLLTLLKITSPTSANTKKKLSNSVSVSSEHSHYKQVYSKTIRLLQTVEVPNNSDQAVSFSQSLLGKVETILTLLKDL